MKLPKIKAESPGGMPDESWTPEQLLAHLRIQYKVLTEPDRKIRDEVGATDADIAAIKADIEGLEKEIAQKIARSN
jgi:hypothetical protein